MVKFQSYLHDCCDEHLLAYLSLINTRQVLTNNEYYFIYEVMPDIKHIESQANLFASKVVTEVANSSTLFRTQRARNLDELRRRMQNTYKYSYFKVLYYVRNMYQLGFNVVHPNHGESLAFIGHVVLFNTLVRKFFRTTKVQNSTTLIRRCDLYLENFLDSIGKDPVWIAGTSGEMGANDFYSSEYEFVLADLKLNQPNVHIESLHRKDQSTGTVADFNPLGNCTYDQTGELIYSVVGPKISSDYLSKAWNLANCISLTSEVTLPNDDSVMITVPADNIDAEMLKFMVHSITGLNVMTGLSVYMAGDGDNISTDDTTPNPGDNGGGGTRGGSGPLNAKPTGGKGRKSNKRKGPGWGQRLIKTGQAGVKAVGDVASHPMVIKLAEELAKSNSDQRRLEAITSVMNEYGVSTSHSSSDINSGLPLLKYGNSKGTTSTKFTKDEL